MDDLRARNLGFETQATRNVLRDTYTLLATTMIPTVIGGLVSAQFGLHLLFRNGLVGFLVTLALMFGLTWLIEKNKDNKIGLSLLYLFTFFLGILLAGSISRVMQYGNSGELIALASVGTMMIFAGCAATTSLFKIDVSLWGKVLMVSIIALLIATIAILVFQLAFLIVALLVAILVISSAFLFYELSLIKQGYQTNAVSATLGIYLSLYNIFTTLLQLFGISFGEKE